MNAVNVIDRVIRFFSMALYRGGLGLGRLLYNLEISGEEHIPTAGPFIIASNHPSKVDFFLLMFVKRKRPDIYLYGGGGRVWAAPFAKALDLVPVGKGTDQRSTPIFRMVHKALQNGRPVGAAPEGEMEWDGRLLPFKPGLAWLALHSQVPLMACVLRGGYSIWPRWATFPKLTGRLQLRIGEPFTIHRAAAGQVTQETIHAVNRRLAEEMQRLEAEP